MVALATKYYTIFYKGWKMMAISDACVLIGVHGEVPVGINCQGCGFVTRKDFREAFAKKLTMFPVYRA